MSKCNPRTQLAFELKKREDKTFNQLAEMLKELKPNHGLRSLDFHNGRMGQWLNTVEQIGEMLVGKGFNYQTFLKRSGYNE